MWMVFAGLIAYAIASFVVDLYVSSQHKFKSGFLFGVLLTAIVIILTRG